MRCFRAAGSSVVSAVSMAIVDRILSLFLLVLLLRRLPARILDL